MNLTSVRKQPASVDLSQLLRAMWPKAQQHGAFLNHMLQFDEDGNGVIRDPQGNGLEVPSIDFENSTAQPGQLRVSAGNRGRAAAIHSESEDQSATGASISHTQKLVILELDG